MKTINETAVVKATTFEELLEQVDYNVDKRGSVTLGVKKGTKLFVVSTHMERLLKSSMTTQKSQDKCTASETTSTGVDSVFSTITPEILGTLEHETIESISDINNESIAVNSDYLTTVLGSDTLADMLQSENIPISNELVIDRGLQDNDREQNSSLIMDKQSDSIARETFSKDVELAMLRLGYNPEANFCKLIREFYEAEDEPCLTAVERCGRRIRLRNWLLEGVNFGCFPPCGFYVRGIPHVMFQGFLTNIDRRIDESHDQQLTEAIQVRTDDQCNAETETILSLDDVNVMFTSLKTNKTTPNKWMNKTVDDFQEILRDPVLLKFEMTKNELIFCLESAKPKLEASEIRFGKSWSKQKLSDFLHKALNSKQDIMSAKSRQKKKFTPNKLSVLCKRKLCGFTKAALNAVLAEHEFDEQYQLWTRESPFSSTTRLSNVGEITWFSAPEFNSETLSYIFSFLDVHHLITNCRIKACKDGFPERHIRKQAWLAVAKENKTRLKIAHVEDLLDKQSDSIARETFSKDVELAMLRLGYNPEANFCKLIREFYEAEDEPGLTAVERCGRRIRLRNWLLEGVNFGCFPPCGFYVRGIPHVMFQGFLTNIDRRIQIIIPYVKSGAYNVRTLGSLEAENLFGEFQDLDPKGSGVIKAEDIPAALESAC